MNAIRNKQLVMEYIESVWNQREMAAIDRYVSDDYRDHSFLPAIPPDKTGLQNWIKGTSDAFDHTTTIESIVAENDEVAIRITFKAVHKGKWRNILPTQREAVIKGFRFFKLKAGKIVEHWALIDGEALQTALTEQHHGCMLPD